jgi:beta-lactamase regulating signal transducer with metallopeptidase domain
MAWTLLLASIDGALVVAAVWILTRALALTPATRTFLWWCAAAKFVLALAWTTPILIPILPPATPAAAAIAAPAPAHVVELAPPTDVGTRLVTRVRDRVGPRLVSRFIPAFLRDGSGLALMAPLRGLGEWGAFAALAWIAGLFLLALVAITRWRDTVSIVRASVAADEAVQRQTADLAARLRLKRVPDVRISDRVETPLVAGLRQPVILLPSGRFDALTDRQQEMAICHELAHLKRADLWLGCVPALAERLFFFHPLARLVSREYSLAREAACDAAVVETLDAAPHDYGRLLLALGVSRPQAGAAAGAAWSFPHLKRRIAMLQELSSTSRRSRVVAAATVALAVLALVPLRLVARPAPAGLQERAVAAPLEVPAISEPVEFASRQLTEPVEQERREPGKDSLTFVLLFGDDETVSGSPEDLRSARRHRRGNESLLWFRRGEREYVIRDEEVLRQARAAWRDFHAHEMQGLVNPDHLAAMANLHIDANLIADVGKLGAQMGSHALELAHDALKNLHVDEALDEKLENLKAKHLAEMAVEASEVHSRELQEAAREMEHQARQLHDRLAHDVRDRMKSDLERHRHELRELKEKIQELEAPLRELEQPLRDLAEPMGDLGRHLGKMGREIGDLTQRAMDDIRDVIERAIASGRAQTVK